MLRSMIWKVSRLLSLGSAMIAIGGPVAEAQVPSDPTELVAIPSVPGDFAISLFWNDNSDNEEMFEIQRCAGDGCSDFVSVGFTPFASINSFNDVGLQEKTSYTYRVRAVNAEGVSGFTNVASAATSYARPNQVVALQGAIVGNTVQLSWTDDANNETSFEVERAENGVSTQYSVIAVLPPDSTSYTDATPLIGASYSYRVRPLRFDVEGGAPETVELTIGAPAAFPGTVGAKGKSRTAIELSWKGRFARNTRVQIQRFDLNTAFWITIAEVAANEERKFVDSGLQARTDYAYRLRTISNRAVSVWESANARTR